MDPRPPAVPAGLRRDEVLAPRTTLEVGGSASCWLEVADVPTLVDGLRWASAHHMAVTVLGGGSNVVVADEGVHGLVVGIGLRGYRIVTNRDVAVVSVAAGEPWDEVVQRTLDDGLVGLECLSGIPGLAGATPIQNVGAYGREIGSLLEKVRVLDRATLEIVDLGAADLQLGYRSSLLRRCPGSFVVLEVTFRLDRRGPPRVEYPELRQLLGVGAHAPTPRQVRAGVLALRRSKSMVIEDGDPNRRSVGSFFVNPVLSASAAARLERTVANLGVGRAVPLYPTDDGSVKTSAAWLIEHAGFVRGRGRGAVGLSTHHCLAVINRGGATAAEIIGFARKIRRTVHDRFGIVLEPEPVFLGFDRPNPLDD